MMDYIKESYQEFKKVTWPTRTEAMRLTGYVIGVSLFVGLFVAGADYVFTDLIRNLLSN